MGPSELILNEGVYVNDHELAASAHSQVPFVPAGTPKGTFTWPAYTNATDTALVFDVPALAVQRGLRSAQCDLWDAYLFSGGPVPQSLRV